MEWNFVGKWRMGGKLRVRTDFLWILRVSNLNVHVGLFLPVLMYGSETVVWKEKERCRIRAILAHIDNLRILLGVKRIDRMPNTLF